MKQNSDVLLEVGEDVAATIDSQARRAALLHAATNDLLYLAEHGDIELLRAVRDLNIHSGTPDSYRHAHELQIIRGTLRHLLASLGFEQAIMSEPPSSIPSQRRARPPIVDVELP